MDHVALDYLDVVEDSEGLLYEEVREESDFLRLCRRVLL